VASLKRQVGHLQRTGEFSALNRQPKSRKREFKNRTNEAVIILKTKQVCFFGTSKAVRLLKIGHLSAISRQVVENKDVSNLDAGAAPWPMHLMASSGRARGGTSKSGAPKNRIKSQIYSEDEGTTHDIIENKGPVLVTHDVHENKDS
jgi:hypothetical protein